MSDSELEYANLSESDSEESDYTETESEVSDNDANLDLARNWYTISTNQPVPAPPRYPFIGATGCTFALAEQLDVLAYYQLFFDDSLINHIVTETNIFAQQQPGSASRSWSPVTAEELHVFFGMKILQGIVNKPEERMYWTTSEVFETPIFSKLLPYRRYYDIQKNLHFSNNEDYNPETHPQPKLNKIWPVFESINNKCRSLYIPERDISIDESLMLYKGRLSWVQYIPLKRARLGIKLYCLCESESGYLYSSIIYTGKGTKINDKYKDLPMSSQVVLSLMEPLLGMGYCLTTDNFYTSPQLADILIKEKTDTYGTVRLNRKEVPVELQKKKLKKGEMIAFQRGKVMLLKWQDKKAVCLLSTVHNPQMEATKKIDREGNAISKPKVVIDYNNTMGGVDRLDQHLHDYPTTRKRGKNTTKKYFFIY